MPRAVLKKGVIVLLEPLPAEWEEGTTLQIEKTEIPLLDIAEWSKSMDQLCAASTDEDEQAMQRAIEEHRKQAKAQMRREMGLTG